MGFVHIDKNGKLIYESFDDAFKKADKETENGTRFGNWKIKRNGDLVYKHPNKSEYIIGKHSLTQEDWISHINGKDWGNESMGDFITAYFTALNKINIRKISITVDGYIRLT